VDDELLFRALVGRTTAVEEAAVETWRRASPENERRFRELYRLLTIASNADSCRSAAAPPPVEDIVEHSEALAKVGGRVVSDAPEGATWRSWVRAVAAVAAIVVLAFGLWRFRFGGVRVAAPAVREVVTGPSEVATITLIDGSVVRLGSKSHLRVETGDAQQIILDGRAYFAVAKQKARPLRIRTSAGDVKVVGTRFDLEANGAQLRLVVVEGRVVLVSHGTESQVAAGEMARVVEGVPVPVVEIPTTRLHVDWLGNFLAFQDTPLRDAVREIESQFGVRIQIADSILGSQTITGWFSGWTLEEVMDVVCAVTNAQYSRSGGAVTVQPRARSGR